MLTRSNIYIIKYDDISQLKASAPVLISGFQVGTVASVDLDPKDMKTVLVTIDVLKKYKIHKSTPANVISTGIMGQKAIELDIKQTCSGDDCAGDGDFLNGGSKGLIQSILGDSDVEEAMLKMQNSIGIAFDTLNARIARTQNAEGITKIIQDIQVITTNLAAATGSLDDLMADSKGNMVAISSNLNSITGNLKDNNGTLTQTLENVEELTSQLSNGDMELTISNAKKATASADDAMNQLNETLESLQAASVQLNDFLTGINNGEGTLGKMSKDSEMYDNLTQATKNLDLLLQDFRLNPGRYVKVSVFGKKGKEYTVPEEDPAFQEDEGDGQ